jgi:ArsR family transcriptional regulator
LDADGERESWVVQVARALADATRYRMLQEIRAAGEMNCSELKAHFPLSQATVSHHIKTLQQAGLVRIRAQGLFRYLSAEPARLAAFASGVVAELGESAKPPERNARPARTKAAARTAPAGMTVHATPATRVVRRKASPAARKPRPKSTR